MMVALPPLGKSIYGTGTVSNVTIAIVGGAGTLFIILMSTFFRKCMHHNAGFPCNK